MSSANAIIERRLVADLEKNRQLFMDKSKGIDPQSQEYKDLEEEKEYLDACSNGIAQHDFELAHFRDF